MANKDRQGPDIRLPVGFGSGLASALLFVGAVRHGSALGLVVTSLAPLPIFIATLGFGAGTGLGAVGAGAVTIVALVVAAARSTLSPALMLAAGSDGVIFALTITLPAWWLARLATMGRSSVILPWLLGRAGFGKQAALLDTKAAGTASSRYPFGDILISIAALAFGIVAAFTLVTLLKQPSYEAGIAKAVAAIEPQIVQMLAPHELPKSLDLALLSRLVVELMPAMAASYIVLTLAANLWLGGLVVQHSHRLAYPWPDIPRDFRLPRLAAPLFVSCLGLAFLHGLAGMIASIAASALGVLFVLQGLAVLHELSRGMRLRGPLLFGLYLTLTLLLPWPLVVIALIGLLEAGFSLRDRKAAAAAKNI